VIEVQLKDFYDRYRTKFIPVDPKQDTLFKEQQQSDPDAVFRDAIQGLCELALTNGVRPVLLYIPILTDLEAGRTNRIALLKRGIAERLQLPFLDFTADIAPGGAKLYLDADPVHLNAEGNRIVAQRLVETLRPRLPR
jgi:lysophospholipase L1-like esterase